MIFSSMSSRLIWQPEQPSSQTVATLALLLIAGLPFGGQFSDERPLDHFAATPCPSRRSRPSGRRARTCCSWCSSTSAPGLDRSVITRLSMPRAGDVPGVGAFDLVADAHAALAQDAAIVILHEAVMRRVDLNFG